METNSWGAELITTADWHYDRVFKENISIIKVISILLIIGVVGLNIGKLVYYDISRYPGRVALQRLTNPILVNWNWSFLPLDLAISATGLTSLWLYCKQNGMWRPLAIVSLVLTFVSGLQAIGFWLFAGDFNMTWWLPNLLRQTTKSTP